MHIPETMDSRVKWCHCPSLCNHRVDFGAKYSFAVNVIGSIGEEMKKMPFGKPSIIDPPNAPQSQSDVTSPKHAQTTSDLGRFDFVWILEHFRALNKNTEPILLDLELRFLASDVADELAGLINKPIAEAYEIAQPVLLQTLFLAKHSSAEESPADMGTPLLGQFLVAINGFISVRNERSLSDYFVLEPPFGEQYVRMIEELKRAYPKGSEEVLEEKCAQSLKAAREGADGTPWTPFIKFMVQYLGYLRDVDADPNKYLHTYELLSELHTRGNSALSHGILGYLMLKIVVTNAKLVCRLAIGLDKQPELIAHLKSAGGQQAGGEDGGQRETLPERAANIIRVAFVTCLNDRSLVKNGKPEGRKEGIYLLANLCLKILFQCRKTRNATQIFENIYNLSPSLSAYPKSQRVTYLYYLGRFFFQNSHFYRAQQALQHAYDESPARQDCVRQRRQILVFLIASNIILGRFPSQALLARPEAQGLADRFLPICFAIRQGDLASFRRHLDFNSPHAEWLLHFRILLQLRNRCEVLVWRSLIRKTWILNGHKPDLSTRAAPTVNIHDLVTVFSYLEKRASSSPNQYTDPDFADIAYDDNDEEYDGAGYYDTTSIESILSSLIDQGILGGYFSHKQMKFAITGAAKKGSALAAGFPEPWGVLKARAEREDGEVPGWKKDVSNRLAAGGLRPGPGSVINLSGVRPVGAVG
jgi:nuclear mRNA export protein PCID2/THP1